MEWILQWKDNGICVKPTRCRERDYVIPKAVELGIYPAGMTAEQGKRFLRKNAEVVVAGE